MLDALARSFEPGATVGEIVDAAAALGWTDLGELSLADLADALLTDASVGASAETARPAEPATADEEDEVEDDGDDDDGDEVEDEDEDADDDDDDEPAKPTARGRRVAATPAKTAKAGKAAKPTKAVAAKPAAKGKPTKPAKVSLDDRMSLDEAAAVLLPLVRALGEATMQQLEQSTAGAGRRKLRFHIGQLVKNGRLERHGMGRGTFYTLT